MGGSTRYWDLALGFRRHQEARFQAEQFLEKAMRNPTPLAHQVASTMLLHQQQHGEAIAEAKLAIAADPNDADGYIALASVLSFTGKAEQALSQVERAIRINSNSPKCVSACLAQSQKPARSADDLERAIVQIETITGRNVVMATYDCSPSRQTRQNHRSIKAGTKQGSLAYYDPLTIRATTYWYPFADSADAERFAEGLRKAGVPE